MSFIVIFIRIAVETHVLEIQKMSNEAFYPINNHKVMKDGSTLRIGLDGFKPNGSTEARIENGRLVVEIENKGKKYMFETPKDGFPDGGLDGCNPREYDGYIDIPTRVSNLKTYM